MTIAAAKTSKPKPATAPLFTGQSTTGPGAPENQQPNKSTDFVNSLLGLLVERGLLPDESMPEAAQAVREHFGCETYYVAANDRTAEQETTARAVLALFNGRNAREVARRLGIGRTTVYRYIKQAGGRS